MKIDIVQIGNSKGIRIPNAVLKQCGFTSNAELHVENDKIIIAPVKSSIRKGWGEKFKDLATEDSVLDVQDINNEFDTKDWKW